MRGMYQVGEKYLSYAAYDVNCKGTYEVLTVYVDSDGVQYFKNEQTGDAYDISFLGSGNMKKLECNN